MLLHTQLIRLIFVLFLMQWQTFADKMSVVKYVYSLLSRVYVPILTLARELQYYV